MNKNLKIPLALVAAAVIAVIAVSASSGDDKPPVRATSSEHRQRLVRADSPRLSEGADATFVEFLDFECEACAALYPTIEDLKDTYGDRVTFVVRYMPLHVSSVNAFRAAEAAGAQGRFKDMYDVLFKRQDEWGHKKSPERDRFFTYADELDLDMRRFRADYDDPTTLKRIQQSETDGRFLGVTGTPTMFLDGKKIEPKSIDDLIAAFDAAVD